MTGSIERDGRYWLAWCSGRGPPDAVPSGWISRSGGLTKRQAKARRFSGPGEAICAAATHGFAITNPYEEER